MLQPPRRPRLRGAAPFSPFRPDFRRPRMDTYEKRNLLEKSYQSAVHEAWKQFIANKPIREKVR